MPIYEYECKACGCRFEELQDMNAAPPACPKCKGGVRKLLSMATPLTAKRGGSGEPCRGREQGCGETSCHSGGCGGKCPGM